MARTTVSVDGRLEVTNFDQPQARGGVFQSLVFAQLFDEIADAPIASPVAVFSDLAGARVRTAQNGIAGLIGTPTRSFPRLDTNSYSFDLEFVVRGFTPWQETLTVPIQATFPETFDGLELGSIGMRRWPFVLTGRTVTLDASNRTVACPNAAVAITGLWRRTGDIDLAAGPPATPVLALPALSANRPVGATIEIVALPPVAEPPRVLLFDVGEGSTTIEISQSVGLLAGQVVGIDVADPERAEYVEIESLAAANDPNSPATAVLRFPLRVRHRGGAAVQRVTVPAPGAADAALVADGAPGDATLFVDTTAAFPGPRLVRIAGGAAVPEYATCAPYEATSDGDGFYRLPPLSRVAAFELSASRALPLPALSSTAISFTPNYTNYENRLDLLLR
jgi:hypothetical protein